MSKKRQYSFASCLYNPNSEAFIKHITRLDDFKSYARKRDDHKRVFKWIVFMYDRQSPLVREIPELMFRKGECALLAGYEVDEDGKFEQSIEDIMLGKDVEVNRLIVSYVSRFADPRYMMLVASWNLQLDNMVKLLSGKQSKDTYTIVKQITGDIEDLTRAVLSSGEEDEVSSLKQQLYERMEHDRLKLNPESLAKYVEDHGELPNGFNPYGEDYKVDKLMFLGDGKAKRQSEDTVVV